MAREEIDIHDYLKVLKKRRWGAFTVFFLIFSSVAAATFMMTPVYKATAQVYIDPGQTAQLNFQQNPYPSDTSAYIETQIGILKSESIAREVIDKLMLSGTDQGSEVSLFSPAGILGFMGLNTELKQAVYGPSDSETVHNFLNRLQVTPVKSSNLVKVSYEATDPKLSADVVNATVQAFIERNLEMKVAPAREAMTWLNEKLDEIRSRMSASSSELQDYKREQELIVTGDKQTNISLQALTELNARALETEALRYEAEIKYQQVNKIGKNTEKLLGLPSVMNNPLIQSLKARQSSLANEVADASKKYGEKHPQMIRLKNEMGELKKQIDDEVGLIVMSIKTDYEALVRAEQSLKEALARQKQEAMNYERRSTQYELMRQDVDSSRQIYDAVLKKFQESNLMGNVNMSNVQFIDRAVPPPSPYKPKKALNMLLGFVLGVFLAVGFTFMVEFLDNTFKNPEEVEDDLGLPFLGIVPSIKSLQGRRQHDNLVTVADPKSPVSEAFRNIRGSILLSTGDSVPKVILICSAMHSEGKSTVAANLACIMAAAGERVLLVDADMRKPRLHRVFRISNGTGVSRLLTKQAVTDDVVRPTALSNLSIITSGPVSPNPAELLGSRTMRECMSELRKDYDRVIIDSPPFLGLADATMITPVIDGVVLVIRSGSTSKDLVEKTSRGMKAINAKVLGVVMNDQSGRSSEYYYTYNYNYYYSERRSAQA